MKARTRRGHDGHDRTKQRLCLLSGLCPLCPALSGLREPSPLPVPPASQSLVCFRWPFHAAFPANSGRIFFIGALSVVSRVVRVFMSVVLCPSGLPHDPTSLVRFFRPRSRKFPKNLVCACPTPNGNAPGQCVQISTVPQSPDLYWGGVVDASA